MNASKFISLKTVSELVNSAKAALISKGFKITNLRDGGVFYTLLEISSQGLADLYKLLQNVVPQMFLASATDSWLDIKAADNEVYRRMATKTKGKVVFSRDTTSGNVIIPAGTVVSTAVDSQGQSYRYLVTDQAILANGASQVTVQVEAEFAGAEYNVGSGQITNILTYITGIDRITNENNWLDTEGTDDEDDETLRVRAKNKWYQLSTGGTREAYISWAQEITGVVVVQVDDEHPRGQGSVDVIITSSAGIPTQALIDQVQAYITEPGRKPLCANVLVLAPTPVTVDWDVTLYVNKEHGELADIETRAEEIIDIMFRYGDTDNPEIKKVTAALGVIRAQAISNLMTIDYVENVVITAPAADVPVSNRELAVKGSVTVTTERLS